MSGGGVREFMACASYNYLEGRKFCVVFVKVIDPETERVRLQCLHGRANVTRRGVSVVTAEGAEFQVPSTALPTVQPSDGSDLLKDAEYFVLVKTDPGIDFFGEGGADVTV
mgnify:FL=1